MAVATSRVQEVRGLKTLVRRLSPGGFHVQAYRKKIEAPQRLK